MNSVTLIGTVASTAADSFVLAVGPDRVPVTWPEKLQLGERVAVEGRVRVGDGVYVDAAAVSVIRSHMV